MGTQHVDVHAHYLPDAYREAALAAGHAMPDGFHELPAWSAQAHIEMMDRFGIAVSMLSISSPGVHFGDDAAARSLARQVNDDGHRARASHPGRFGLFASLPLPDVEGAIEEIGYCYDELEVDGVCLLTNAGGVYLGDPCSSRSSTSSTGAGRGSSSTRPRRRVGSTRRSVDHGR